MAEDSKGGASAPCQARINRAAGGTFAFFSVPDCATFSTFSRPVVSLAPRAGVSPPPAFLAFSSHDGAGRHSAVLPRRTGSHSRGQHGICSSRIPLASPPSIDVDLPRPDRGTGRTQPHRECFAWVRLLPQFRGRKVMRSDAYATSTGSQDRQHPLPIPPPRLRRHPLQNLPRFLDGRLPAAFTQHLGHR